MNVFFSQLLRQERGFLLCSDDKLTLLEKQRAVYTDKELWQQFWDCTQSNKKLLTFLKSRSSSNQEQFERYLEVLDVLSTILNKAPLIQMINQEIDKIAQTHNLWAEQLIKVIYHGFYITETTLDKNYKEENMVLSAKLD